MSKESRAGRILIDIQRSAMVRARELITQRDDHNVI